MNERLLSAQLFLRKVSETSNSSTSTSRISIASVGTLNYHQFKPNHSTTFLSSAKFSTICCNTEHALEAEVFTLIDFNLALIIRLQMSNHEIKNIK